MAAEFAPAKVNLCLHVTGQRADGYHLLDSLVVFAGVGDQLSVAPSARLSLRLTGPMAKALAGTADEDNLVLRAARLFGPAPGAQITLDKRLPVASGIGGGSADAAAALRLLARHWQRPLPGDDQLLSLGADLPVCLQGQPCRMQGIGETIRPLPALPPLWLVLANPGVAVPTPAVFRALAAKDNPPLPARLPEFADTAALIAFLKGTRNDLEAPAIHHAPVIADCLAMLAGQKDCALARMSGSGATCFGLFASEVAARAAALALQAARPGWWCAAAPVLDQFSRETT